MNPTQMTQDKEPMASTYASVAEKTCFPSRDQAIIIDACEEASIKDYTVAVGNVINPSNIRFTSRMANNRICVYLSSSSLVNKLIDEKVYINIHGHSLPIRPLLMKAKRIILSNVCPIIPHAELVKLLTGLNIHVLSPITFVKAGFTEPGYTHILSFRRQLYIHPDDMDKLPDRLQVKYEDINYWIFISSDNPLCFICKKEGHLAKHCPTENSTPNQDPNPPQDNRHDKQLSTSYANINSQYDLAPPTINKQTDTSADLRNIEKTPKRPLSSTSSNLSKQESSREILPDTSQSEITDKKSNSVSTNTDSDFTPPTTKKISSAPARKKMKKESNETTNKAEDLDDPLTPIKEQLIHNPEAYVLDYSKLREFLFKAKGNPDIVQLTLTFSSDIPAIIKMLRETYTQLKDRALKCRFSRIIKKLEQHLSWSSEPFSRDTIILNSDFNSDTDRSLTSDDESTTKGQLQPSISVEDK